MIIELLLFQYLQQYITVIALNINVMHIIAIRSTENPCKYLNNRCTQGLQRYRKKAVTLVIFKGIITYSVISDTDMKESLTRCNHVQNTFIFQTATLTFATFSLCMNRERNFKSSKGNQQIKIHKNMSVSPELFYCMPQAGNNCYSIIIQ